MLNLEKKLDKIEKKIDAIEKLHDKESLMCEEIKDMISEIREENSEDEDIVHRGISYRKFEKRFSIADDIQVKGAKLENGLLTIDLERIVPEEKKPRTIAIR